MNRQDIIHAASRMETILDLLALLNRIKADEYGSRACPFTVRHLNYFINPKRKDSCRQN